MKQTISGNSQLRPGRYCHRGLPTVGYEILEIWNGCAVVRSLKTHQVFRKPLEWCCNFLEPAPDLEG